MRSLHFGQQPWRGCDAEQGQLAMSAFKILTLCYIPPMIAKTQIVTEVDYDGTGKHWATFAGSIRTTPLDGQTPSWQTVPGRPFWPWEVTTETNMRDRSR